MNVTQRLKLYEALILLNTYDYDSCRNYISSLLQENESIIHFRIILEILELIDMVKEERFQEIKRQLDYIVDLLERIEDDSFNKGFKELINQIVEDFKDPPIGFPKKKLVINWHVLVK
ncbi:MAG: hypothetical protein RMJ51_01515 [Candidatus Calescibacterium sp.]|nr:hypothetical protein [Candidatus Calescibacterium sp.]MCX7971794.1 hypothetical protein [bacterium]MDW8194907.1 hypothetical protein [Candidatus Calescibacterium sp.]